MFKFQNTLLGEITKKPIRGASIINPTSKSGTLSNEEGEFELTIEAYPTELIFSHVSYQKMSKLVENNSFQKIELPVAVIELAEVQVGNPAVAILNAVIRKAEGDSSKIHYKKAFYQKTSQFKGKYTSIHESFMNVAWSTKGLEEWKPLSVRVAELNQRRYKHQNFLSVVFSKTRIYWEYPFLPLNSVDVTKNYSFAIEGYSSIDTDNELVAISCTPKVKDNKVLQFEGTFYVLTKFDALVSVKGLYTYPLTKWRTTQEVDIKYDIDSANKMVLRVCFGI